MRLLTKAAFAALLLGTTAIAAPAFADDTGCPPGLHRADSEGGQNNCGPPRRLRGRSEQRGPPGRLRGRSEQCGPPRRLRGRSEQQRGPPGRLRGRAEQCGPPRRLRGRSEQQRGPPRRLRRWSEQQPRSARPNSEGGQNNKRSAAPTPRVVRTTTRSAAPRRSHPRARQRSRPASNRLAPASRDSESNRSRPAASPPVGIFRVGPAHSAVMCRRGPSTAKPSARRSCPGPEPPGMGVADRVPSAPPAAHRRAWPPAHLAPP